MYPDHNMCCWLLCVKRQRRDGILFIRSNDVLQIDNSLLLTTIKMLSRFIVTDRESGVSVQEQEFNDRIENDEFSLVFEHHLQ